MANVQKPFKCLHTGGVIPLKVRRLRQDFEFFWFNAKDNKDKISLTYFNEGHKFFMSKFQKFSLKKSIQLHNMSNTTMLRFIFT